MGKTDIFISKGKLFLIFLSFVFSGCVAASTNNRINDASVLPTEDRGFQMPDVELSDLEGRVYEFPKDFASKSTVLVFGFSHAQKESTQTWIDPLLELKKKHPELSFFKVPLIDRSGRVVLTQYGDFNPEKLSRFSQLLHTETLR